MTLWHWAYHRWITSQARPARLVLPRPRTVPATQGTQGQRRVSESDWICLRFFLYPLTWPWKNDDWNWWSNHKTMDFGNTGFLGCRLWPVSNFEPTKYAKSHGFKVKWSVPKGFFKSKIIIFNILPPTFWHAANWGMLHFQESLAIATAAQFVGMPHACRGGCVPRSFLKDRDDWPLVY